MRFKSPSLLLFLIIFLINSCTLEKRRYSSGYYMSSKSNSTRTQQKNGEQTIVENTTVENSAEMNNLVPENIEHLADQKESARNNSASKGSSKFLNADKTQSEQQLIQSKNEVSKFKKRNKEVLNRLDGKIENANAYALSTRRKMSTILKLAIIFAGLGIIALIVGFFSWYFYFLTTITGTVTAPLYPTLLSAGLVSVAIGLFLFIAYWLFN